MTHPGRRFTRNAPPSKAAQRIVARMVVLQRSAAGLAFPDYLVAQVARTHGLTVGEVEGMIEAERERRANAS